jgi:hypothetical protein
MIVSLTIVRYRTWMIPFGFLSMAFFQLAMMLRKKSAFYKLMGCGKNGTFDIIPDLHQWAILATHETIDPATTSTASSLYGNFINRWIGMFAREQFTLMLAPIQGHGLWDGKTPFHPKSSIPDSGLIGTLTRATIRPSKLRAFWKAVPAVASTIQSAAGFRFSVGIGEIPWIKQATFSLWESEDDLKQFAYKMNEHRQVIQDTRSQNWYSEELFYRFRLIRSFGTLHGKNPLQRSESSHLPVNP